MLQPKKTKYRKAFKGKIKGEAKGGTTLNFGSYGLKAMEPERITARQIEAARRAITRHIKRQGRLWIRVFPDVPVSKKPAEVRQGKGKGSVEYWAARVKPGRILFELDGAPVGSLLEGPPGEPDPFNLAFSEAFPARHGIDFILKRRTSTVYDKI